MLLVHGFAGTPATWTPLLPALEQHHEVLAPTLLGHSGGPAYLAGSPPTPSAMADALERDMDSAGFEQAHLVGNSLGGWLALELAARGRALSTTALAPAGGRNHGGPEQEATSATFAGTTGANKLLGRTPAQLMPRRRFRALALRSVVVRPADVPAALAVDGPGLWRLCYLPAIVGALEDGWVLGICCDRLACADLVGTWDRILRWPRYAERFRRMVPGARWIELTGLGHCPMLDDAQLTALTILELTWADVGDGRPKRASVAPRSR